MTKLSLSALALVVAAGLAAPAFAAPVSLTEQSTFGGFDAANVLQRLQSKGINATDVAEANDQVRATVTLEDGQQVFRYFDEDTLQPINAAHGNTRVLSKLDVGRVAVPVSLDSLTHVDTGNTK